MNLDWVPDACTLPTAEQPFRVAEFDSLFAHHLHTARRLDRQTLELVLTAEPRAVADLTARENECCSFFHFDLTPISDGVRLRITVPAAYAAVLDGLTERLPA